MISGAAEPGGRLPTTWPASLEGVPVIDVVPRDGVLCYGEGIHIGYRAWLRAARTPAFEFGAASGHTVWRQGDSSVDALEYGWAVTVPFENVGDRAGKHVVQVYAERADSAKRPLLQEHGVRVVRCPKLQADTCRRRSRRRRRCLARRGQRAHPRDRRR